MNFSHSPDIYNKKSAQEVLPIIIELVKPQSVIDIGCGLGTWLSVFEDLSIHDIVGVDGDYVERDKLYIDKSKFIAHDLATPFRHNHKFDLVVSLEVAEHISEQAADIFVESLVSLGDTILFSAAVPGQGGQDHINEQWPEYWQLKFSKFGYKFSDVIRRRIWRNRNIEWWYRQNLYLVSNQKTFINDRSVDDTLLPIIHPDACQFFLKEAERVIAMQNRYIDNIEKGKIGIKLSLQILKNAFLSKLQKND